MAATFDTSFWLTAGGIFCLLLLSAFFSGSETAMMAANRYRLRHAAQNGHRGAKLALALLAKTDQLLGLILLGVLHGPGDVELADLAADRPVAEVGGEVLHGRGRGGADGEEGALAQLGELAGVLLEVGVLLAEDHQGAGEALVGGDAEAVAGAVEAGLGAAQAAQIAKMHSSRNFIRLSFRIDVTRCADLS